MSPPVGRIESLDLARGIAVALMILNHGVIALVPFAAFPSWALVPIDLITRFASSLFILVFGISMAVAYLPHVREEDWPRQRRRPLWTGLASPILLLLLGRWIARSFDFVGLEPLQAILVEHQDYYSWGQLTRGPL